MSRSAEIISQRRNISVSRSAGHLGNARRTAGKKTAENVSKCEVIVAAQKLSRWDSRLCWEVQNQKLSYFGDNFFIRFHT